MNARLHSTGLVFGIVVAAGAASAQEIADTIYSGGPILTIDDAQPAAEAVAVRDGRILAVGAVSDVAAHQGDATDVFDLDGRTLLPGFVDSHGHVVMGGLQALSANLLAPPDGEVTDIASLQSTLSAWAAENADVVDQVNVIIGFGYDNAQLAEMRHPTREDLDAVSTEVPIMIVHQSGHLGVANSKALEIAGIDASTKDPAGGVIRRDPDGAPNGVLEEYAFFTALVPLLSELGPEGLAAFAKAGAEMWARFGYTTAQDGRSSGGIVEALKAVDAAGDLPVDVIAYPDVLEFKGLHRGERLEGLWRARPCRRLQADHRRLAPGLHRAEGPPLHDDPVGDYPPGYHGYASVTMEQIEDAVDWCYARGIQVITHANGEGASDMLIAALGAAQDRYGDPGNRPVLIHGQFLREDQVDSYKRLGVFPSLFPMHTFYWGDWHRRAHGRPRERRQHLADRLGARARHDVRLAPRRAGGVPRLHAHPVGHPRTRRARSGDILGPSQRVDVMTALRAMTIWPAWQQFEEDDKGSIEVGKIADFVILLDDPTAVDPETLDDLRVLVTIKNDEGGLRGRRERRPRHARAAGVRRSTGSTSVP